MTENVIRFDDGAAYEEMMGVWSRRVGEEFLDWLAPPSGQRWIDIGCGNGAFTELLVERCAPTAVLGVDPSPGQLTYARERHAAGVAEFRESGAVPLTADNASFDHAVMALVLFFVPDPRAGIAEMRRVVAPGGTVSAYVWDILEPGGFPGAPVQDELRRAGFTPPLPPSAEVSRIGTLEELWTDAGLLDVDTTAITVERSFPSYDDFWRVSEISIGMWTAGRDLDPAMRARLKEGLRGCVPVDDAGRVTYSARANAVKGRVPE